MQIDAEFRQKNYPLRQGKIKSDLKAESHSLNFSRSELKRITQGYNRILSQQECDQVSRLKKPRVSKSKYAEALNTAWRFALFAFHLKMLKGYVVTDAHIEQAYALLCRCVVATPNRIDRVISSGLASSVIADRGMSVHLLVESAAAIPFIQNILFDTLNAMGMSIGTIMPGDDEVHRKNVYKKQIALTSSRECALDFLRDAVNWPQRGNAVTNKIDMLKGERSRNRTVLMRGLPCAIHIDIDSTLIDNARTPIVLTKDAHPMHEIDELKRSFEMVEHVELGNHYRITNHPSEVELTDLGKRQLQAWSAELGGIWSIEHIAQSILCIAIVATELIKKNVHYEVEGKSIVWLVQDSLVPGMQYFTQPFVNRMIEIREDCMSGTQQEIVSRASYQQIFNRYVHLCGCCHVLDKIDDELKSIYGLSSISNRAVNSRLSFSRYINLSDDEQRNDWILKWSKTENIKACRFICVHSAELFKQLADVLKDANPLLISGEQQLDIFELAKPGALLLVLNAAVEYLVYDVDQQFDCPIQVLVVQRSIKYSEDVRNLNWLQLPSLIGAPKVLLLSNDDAIFEDISLRWIETIGKRFGLKFANNLFENKIRRIQSVKAHEFYKLRKSLMNHDVSMQGLLSFSGRGLYE